MTLTLLLSRHFGIWVFRRRVNCLPQPRMGQGGSRCWSKGWFRLQQTRHKLPAFISQLLAFTRKVQRPPSVHKICEVAREGEDLPLHQQLQCNYSHGPNVDRHSIANGLAVLTGVAAGM